MGDIHSSAVPHMESAKSLYVVCETAVLFVVMLVVSCHGCVCVLVSVVRLRCGAVII